MSTLPLSFYIDSAANIQATKDLVEKQLNEVYALETDRRKVSRLLEIVAELQIELEFVQAGMREEVDMRNRKKFWQFWK